MSNTQTKSVLQRAVGGIFLLALIALIAVLLLQPSDKLPNTTSQNSNAQKPTLSISANDSQANTQNQLPTTPEIQGPALVLESTTDSGPKLPYPDSTEIIGEDIWQSVEQNSTQPKQPISQITGEPIVIASALPDANQPKTAPKTTAPVKPQETPKVASKPKTETPKLELISGSSSTPKTNAPKQTTSTSTNTGKWYVQLGAFSNGANAQKLMAEFKQKGYNVRIQKDNQLNRVQIGPYATKKEAEQVQSRTKGGSLNPSIFQAK